MELATLILIAVLVALAVVGTTLLVMIKQAIAELRTILLDAEERGIAATKAVARVMEALGLLMDGVGLVVNHLDVQHRGASCSCKMGKTTPQAEPNTLSSDEPVNP